MNNKEYYGNAIYQARSERKIPQKRLAARCKMSQQNFSKIERDERKIQENLLGKSRVKWK